MNTREEMVVSVPILGWNGTEGQLSTQGFRILAVVQT